MNRDSKIPYRFIILAFCLVVSLLAVPSWAQDQDKENEGSEDFFEDVFDAKSYRLDNGMQVVVLPNHRAPVITHMVWYKAGAADEEPGVSGIAHFLEHLMFKGSVGFEPGEFSKTIRALGGQDNAFTSQDYTAYYQSVSKDNLETVMKMESGRMRGATFPPDEVESERKVILEERSQRIENDPQATLDETMRAALFTNHPYAIPTIGWREEMRKLTRDDALAFYKKYYAPNNAILIVSGDVEGEEVLALAKKYYGSIDVSESIERKRPKIPILTGSVHLELSSSRVMQDSYQAIILGPTTSTKKSDALAMEVLQNIMSDGSSSRLYKSLVVDQKIASSAGMYFNGDAWDYGTITFYGTPVPGHSVQEIEEAIRAEIRKVIEDGVTETEIKDAVERLRADLIYARDSVSGPAMLVGRTLATGSTMEDIRYWPYDIGMVIPSQIQDVAESYLNPDKNWRRYVHGYLLKENEQ